jgi:hypothetical protein
LTVTVAAEAGVARASRARKAVTTERLSWVMVLLRWFACQIASSICFESEGQMSRMSRSTPSR